MKPYLILLTFLLLFTVSMAQKTVNSRVQKYVVEFPYVEIPKALPEIKKKISTIPGVSISGYCSTVKAVFFTSTDDSYFNLLIAFKEMDLVYYIRNNVKETAYCEEVGTNKTEY
jgi:hypothetical protein